MNRRAVVVLPNYKEIVDLIKKGSDLEAQEKIMELREAALNCRAEVLDLMEQLKALNETADLTKRVVWQRPFYWLTRDGQEKDGPFCQRCWDTDKNLIRLQHRGGGYMMCFACKFGADDPELRVDKGAFAQTGDSFEPK